MNIIKKILKFLGYALLSIIVLLSLVFGYFSYNPKPELIRIERMSKTDAQIDQKARELVDQMSTEEKVQMMSPWLKGTWHWYFEMLGDGMRYNQKYYQAGGNERLGIPTMRFFDGPRGMVCCKAICFPVSIGRAASFDRDIEYRVGEAIGKEIRANGGNYFGGVCINLLRHPAGGRAQESYGEDSYMLGQMGSALTKGVQSQNVMACIKHYALNNQEDTRTKINVEADERVLREVYLAHFKECIAQGAASVMGAYNRFRGEQCCHSKHLLTTVLKEDWDFKGFTISDFKDGIRDTEKAANAGMDVEMPSIEDYGDKLLEAVEAGKVPETAIDESAFRVARTIFKFETAPDPLHEYPKELIGCKEHIALELEAAEKSMVLMQNKENVLPLNPSELKNVLLVGALAIADNIGDHGSSRVRPEYIVTPMQGFQAQYGRNIRFSHDTGEDLDRVKRLAREVDAVVFIVGYNYYDEGEAMGIGGDRANLRLHDNESKLLKEVGPVNEKSVAVLIGGSAIVVEEWKNQVKGIIHAFYPGMEGGTAIAKTIFGAVNPGGKLPFTVASDEGHYPAFDSQAEKVTYDRYHGYIKLDHDGNEAAFPFGFGLSYTTFKQANADIQVFDDRVELSLNVTNTGPVAGDQVVQLYIGFDQSSTEREHKLLKGFQRVSLEPGETKTVILTCPFDKITWYNPNTAEWELERMKYEAYIGSSSDEKDLIKKSFRIE